MACQALWVVLCPVAELPPEAEAGCLGEVEEGAWEPLRERANEYGMPCLLAGRRMSGDGGVGWCQEAGGRGAVVAEHRGSERSNCLG